MVPKYEISIWVQYIHNYFHIYTIIILLIFTDILPTNPDNIPSDRK